VSIFERLESNVRRYCRSFPAVFARARGPFLYAESGEEYVDFFTGAGAMNYGHNNPAIKRRVLAYLESDGLHHGLDLHTSAKREFLERLDQLVLRPKGLDYKVQFCGPSGTEAVEAALKLAKKVTGRPGVFAFMGAYHGLSLGSVSVTGDRRFREGAGVRLPPAGFLPYPDGPGADFDSIGYVDAALDDPCSGVDKPAAIIFESVQAEGGVFVAPAEWLRRLRALCDRHDILLICDDVQAGCHRTGPFFSFEAAGITPDLVVLSKSISGIGAPMSLLLIRREYDAWNPGEHAGTFRGNQLAFVGATAALEYARESRIEQVVRAGERLLGDFLRREVAAFDGRIAARGRGMIWGVELSAGGRPGIAGEVSRRCFDAGLVIETAGRGGTVLKLLPPLNADPGVLERGCSILAAAIRSALRGAGDPGAGYTPAGGTRLP
jgi:diaminobutyrate-2-oxoglutarate transaminase